MSAIKLPPDQSYKALLRGYLSGAVIAMILMLIVSLFFSITTFFTLAFTFAAQIFCGFWMCVYFVKRAAKKVV